MDLTKITYLMVFPDGEIWYGLKKEESVSHYVILEDMQRTNKEFMEMTKYYDLEDEKIQKEIYKQIVSLGAVIYHSWATCVKEQTSDANIYLPSTIYKEQIDLFESIKDQFDNSKLLVLSKLVEYDFYTDLKQLSHKIEDMNVNKLMEYMEENLVKQK